MMMLPATKPRATQASCRQRKSLVLMGMSMQVYPGRCFQASWVCWSSWMDASLLGRHIQGGNFWAVFRPIWAWDLSETLSQFSRGLEA